MKRRHFFAPEVIQTSAMDCGPAALKCILSGFGLSANYQRLRELCRTGADGTSIDTLEELGRSLGLHAQQEIVPIHDAVDVVRHQGPAIAVMKGDGVGEHFVVAWNVVGSWVQLMDPARGRTWMHASDFMRNLYVHTQPLPEDDLVAWYGDCAWKAAVDRRLRRAGVAPSVPTSPHEIAITDASARVLERFQRRGIVSRSNGARTFASLKATGLGLGDSGCLSPIQPSKDSTWEVSGCVLLPMSLDTKAKPAELSDAAQRVLAEKETSIGDVLRAELPVETRAIARAALGLAAVMGVLSIFEVIIMRAAFNASSLLSLSHQRITGVAVYFGIAATIALLEWRLERKVLMLGRAVDLRMRMALLRKLPKLPDKYFRSRPTSDMTSRSEGLHAFHQLPPMLLHGAKSALDILLTSAALCLTYPGGIGWVLLILLFALGVPVVAARMRTNQEARTQSHSANLSQIYLDTLLGLLPMRTHGGQLAIRGVHDGALTDWRLGSRHLVRSLAAFEGIQGIGALLATVGLLIGFLSSPHGQGAMLVIAFWALRLPMLSSGLSAAVQQAAPASAAVRRILEPLTADEVPVGKLPFDAKADATMVIQHRQGVAISLRDAVVTLSANRVINDISLAIEPGEHVAIVGNSGAGKSSVVAALLGFLELDSGTLQIDGIDLADYDMARLRRESVWVDPNLQLWNLSLLENLLFGNPVEGRNPLGPVLKDAALSSLLERLPDGMGTRLGESGVKLSGGEGQRVRVGRALMRRGPRLVLLDEAFRGLERDVRKRLSLNIRRRMRYATLIEVTHDVSDTLSFDRVIVIEDGQLVEQGTPTVLLEGNSRYSALVNADISAQSEVWKATH